MPAEKLTNSIESKEGIIYQSVAGFYYIWSQGQSYATKPKGLFRHHNMKPMVGDRVAFELAPHDAESEGRLVEIYPRDNELRRPALANVNYGLLVASMIEPDFSYSLLDHFLVYLSSQKIQAIIVLTKLDRLEEEVGADQAQALVDEVTDLYTKVGYPVVSYRHDQASLDAIRSLVEPAIYVVLGQSGVGKSTLLNSLIPEADIQTAAISDALNRGRHTTREVTLYPFEEGLLADTPGFSAIDFEGLDKEDLRLHFPEFVSASPQCKFRSCLHLQEPGCQVKALVEAGEIAQSRYLTYLQIYDRLDKRKPVYRRKD